MQETLNGEESPAIKASRADRLATLEERFTSLEERVNKMEGFISQARRAAQAQEKLKNPEVQAKLKQMERLKNEIMKDIGA